MAVTWDLYVDPFSASYTFDGDLGIYLRGAGMCVASADAKTNVGGGKWYFEIEYFSNSSWFASDPFLGLANPDNTLYTYNYLGNEEDELGFHVPDGFYRYDYGTYVAYPSGGGISVSQGDILMIAIDLDDAGGKLWFGFNGVWLDSGNPATGANATRTDLKSIGFKWSPAITAGGTTEYKLYAQSGNVNYTIPAGFDSWDPASSTITYILAPVGVQVETTIDKPVLDEYPPWDGIYWDRNRSNMNSWRLSGDYCNQATIWVYDSSSCVVGALGRRIGHKTRYFELDIDDSSGASGNNRYGVVIDGYDVDTAVGSAAGSYAMGNGIYYNGGAASASFGAVWTGGDGTYQIGVLVNFELGMIWFAYDDFWYGDGGILVNQSDPWSGLNPAIQNDNIKSQVLYPAMSMADPDMTAALNLKSSDFVNYKAEPWADWEPYPVAAEFKFDSTALRDDLLILTNDFRTIELNDIAGRTRAAFSTASVSSGKKYFEMQLGTWASYLNAEFYLGMLEPGQDPDRVWGNTPNSHMWDTWDRRLYSGGSIVDSNFPISDPTWADGMVIQVAVDFDNGRMWYGIDNSWIQGDPAAGTGNPVSVVVGEPLSIGFGQGQDNKPMTLLVRSADLNFSPPVGFSAIDATAWHAPALNVQGIQSKVSIQTPYLHDNTRPYWDPSASDQVFYEIYGLQRQKGWIFDQADTAGAPYATLISGFAWSSGKKYFEVEFPDAFGLGGSMTIGLVPTGFLPNAYIGSTADSYGLEGYGRYWNDGSFVTGVNLAGALNKRVGVIADLDTGKIWFVKDNVIYGADGGSPDPLTGTDPAFDDAAMIGASMQPAAAYGSNPGHHTVLILKSADFLFTKPTGYEGWGDPVTSMVEPKEVRVRTNIGQVRLESTYLPHIVGNFTLPKITMGYRIDNVRGSFRIPNIKMHVAVNISNALNATFKLPKIRMQSRLDEVAMVRGNFKIPLINMSSYLQQSLMVSGNMQLGKISMNAHISEGMTLSGTMQIAKPLIRAKLTSGGSSEYLLTNKRRGSDWEPYVSS